MAKSFNASAQSRIRAIKAGFFCFLVISLCVYGIAVIPIGFNATDDGFILAQSQRILSAQIPHGDFISPRPAGSPIVHSVTYLLPTPLLVTSRALVLIQLLVTAWAQVRLLGDDLTRPLTHPWTAMLIAASFVLSLHTFPLMAWHTIDGVFFASIGAVVATRGVQKHQLWVIVVGSFIAGIAATTKQSFFPIIALLPLLVMWRSRARNGQSPWRHLLGSVSGVAAPLSIYLAVVAIAGGGAVFDQVFGASSPDRFALVSRDPRLLALALFAMAVAAMALLAPGTRAIRGITGWWGSLMLTALQAIIVFGALLAILDGRLDLSGRWSITMWWLALASTGVWTTLRRSIPIAAIFLLALGAMTSLSWGYANPSLASGALILIILLTSRETADNILAKFQFVPAPRRWFPELLLESLNYLVVLGVVICLLSASYASRSTIVYRDVPRAEQSVALGNISAALQGINSNPHMAEVLRQVAECLEEHPSDRLAVVPDGAIVSALNDSSNPLPVDWWYPPEIIDERSRVLDRAATATSLEAGHLVLFQTFRIDGIAAQPPGFATLDTPIFDYPAGYASDLFAIVPGDVITCGGFIGRYRAPVDL